VEWLIEAGHKFLNIFGREGVKLLAHRAGLAGHVPVNEKKPFGSA